MDHKPNNKISLKFFSESGCVWVIPAQRCEGLDKLPGMDEWIWKTDLEQAAFDRNSEKPVKSRVES